MSTLLLGVHLEADGCTGSHTGAQVYAYFDYKLPVFQSYYTTLHSDQQYINFNNPLPHQHLALSIIFISETE